jgi:urease accessory protein
MLQVFQRLDHVHDALSGSVTLDYDTRQKARIKTITDNGVAIGIFVDRGNPLRVGEILKTECGLYLQVKGANEPVTTANSKDWLAFSKVCYHLGNRHTKVQIGERWLRFKTDHVLQELAKNHGLTIDNTPAVFEPESGAYSKGAHSHSHEHAGEDSLEHKHAH